MASKSFVAAMKEYFGLLPGQQILDFGRRELGSLSYTEKMEFHKMLREQAQIDCEEPKKPE